MLSNVYGHFLIKAYPYFWKYRHFWDKDWAESYASQQSILHPHRQLILNAIETIGPFDSLVEYGCGGGANLILLKEKYPKVTFYGLDISESALRTAKKATKGLGITYYKKRCRWANVLLTDAFLIYKQSNDSVLDWIDAFDAYVGCEWHSDEGPFLKEGHSVHNFKKLLPGCELRKLTWDDWQDDGWSTYGHIITWIR